MAGHNSHGNNERKRWRFGRRGGGDYQGWSGRFGDEAELTKSSGVVRLDANGAVRVPAPVSHVLFQSCAGVAEFPSEYFGVWHFALAKFTSGPHSTSAQARLERNISVVFSVGERTAGLLAINDPLLHRCRVSEREQGVGCFTELVEKSPGGLRQLVRRPKECAACERKFVGRVGCDDAVGEPDCSCAKAACGCHQHSFGSDDESHPKCPGSHDWKKAYPQSQGCERCDEEIQPWAVEGR